MQYYSTNHQSSKVSFKEAMTRSEATDGGLYMPEKLPLLPRAYINNLQFMSLKDIAFVINNTLIGSDMPSHLVKRISDEAASYPMPLYQIEDGIYVLELFHGPTKTVKDFGAQTLTRIIRHLNNDTQNTLNVLVASNGNSASAIAHALHNVPGVNVFVLYPKGLPKSHIDAICSLGDNIHVAEVRGTIDDCREMLKKAFNDSDLNDTMMLTSANSMNIGSLLPSTIPFFYGYAQIACKCKNTDDIYVSVPTGRCGNLLAGYIAQRMGLPIKGLIAACNENGAFANYLDNRISPDAKTKTTYSYGMDMGHHPHNVTRFEDICQGDLSKLRKDITAEVVTDDETAKAINDVYRRTGYLLDPHSAVSYVALKKRLPKGAAGLVMATAHPSLSYETLSQINDGALKLPFKMKEKTYCNRPEIILPATYGALRKYLKYYDESQQPQVMNA